MIVIQGLGAESDPLCPRGIGEGMRNKMQVGEVAASVFGISMEIGGVEACKNSVFVYFARPNPASALHLMVSRTRPMWSPTWTKGPGEVLFRQYTVVAFQAGGKVGIIVPWEHIPNLPAPAKMLVVTDWCGHEPLILRQAQKASLTYGLAESRRMAAASDPIAANILGIITDILAGRAFSQCVTPPARMQVIPPQETPAERRAAARAAKVAEAAAKAENRARRAARAAAKRAAAKRAADKAERAAAKEEERLLRSKEQDTPIDEEILDEEFPLPGDEEGAPDYPSEEPAEGVSTKLIVGGVVAAGLAIWMLRGKGKGLGGIDRYEIIESDGNHIGPYSSLREAKEDASRRLAGQRTLDWMVVVSSLDPKTVVTWLNRDRGWSRGSSFMPTSMKRRVGLRLDGTKSRKKGGRRR